MKFVSKAISYIFHPLLSIMYALLIVLYPFGYLATRNSQLQTITFSVVFIISFVLPVLFIASLRYFSIIQSLKMSLRQDRYLPYFSISVYYLFIWFIIRSESFFDPVVAKTFLLSGLLLILVFVLNFWVKISAHTLSACTILGMVLRLVYYYNETNQLFLLLCCIIISGFIATSRLYLKAHTFKEVFAGFVFGLVLGLIFPSFI